MALAWIPNLLTLGNLTCGFVSLIFSGTNSPEGYITAALLILLAGLLDGLDGQVARRLKVDSPIGKELDSLADCVAFGVAPGYLAYKTYLTDISLVLSGRTIDVGILVAAVFPICAAYRLARFNIRSSAGSFSGLPSPIAGILVALAAICFPQGVVPAFVFAAIFLLVGFLMVSTVTYAKPQSFVFKNIHGLKLAGLVIVVLVLLFLFRFWIILLFITLYVLSGVVGYFIRIIEKHRY
ncbi:MAG: CDP-alcohol phosphatidyltransferase [Syntrophorhabdaceae bacterium PtaU1.Bin034]|jgi:CDP-diacylglycerol--serine O-phosphatidyltransferase|nr:MAG: CDP-alcohol phosphatidyltransferase [Syntrophorhabdaceae bacterium PtaU1.Bin034]